MDEIYGVNLDMLAEIFQQQSDCNSRYGRDGGAKFEEYLASRGMGIHQWVDAWNAWGQRFKADPTGMTEAGFHQKLALLSQKAHFGDVPDMSQDTQEGITLDQYAQITVAVSRAGADADAIVKQFGLQDVAHWQRANAAWAKKMGEDTSHRLTMAYGQLYSKYAGPSFQQEQLQQSAAILAERNKPQDRIDSPQEQLTPDLCRQKMQSPSQNERFKYAYLYANMIDLNNVPDRNEATMAVTPILMEMIERHDEGNPSDPEKGTRQLWDLGVRGDDFRGAVARCMNRAQDVLNNTRGALDPIRDKAVPERVFLQTKEHDYVSLIETLTDYLNRDWNPPMMQSGAMSMGPGPAMGSGAMPFPSHMPVKTGGGFPKWLLAPLILIIVGGALFATKGREWLAARNAAAASASVAPSASAPVAAKATATAAPTAAPVAAADTPAASASAKPAAATKGAKKKKKP